MEQNHRKPSLLAEETLEDLSDLDFDSKQFHRAIQPNNYPFYEKKVLEQHTDIVEWLNKNKDFFIDCMNVAVDNGNKQYIYQVYGLNLSIIQTFYAEFIDALTIEADNIAENDDLSEKLKEVAAKQSQENEKYVQKKIPRVKINEFVRVVNYQPLLSQFYQHGGFFNSTLDTKQMLVFLKQYNRLSECLAYGLPKLESMITQWKKNQVPIEKSALGIVWRWLIQNKDFFVASFTMLPRSTSKSFLAKWTATKIKTLSKTSPSELATFRREYSVLSAFSEQLHNVLKKAVDIRKRQVADVFPDPIACFIDSLNGLNTLSRNDEILIDNNFSVLKAFLAVNQQVVNFMHSNKDAIEPIIIRWQVDQSVNKSEDSSMQVRNTDTDPPAQQLLQSMESGILSRRGHNNPLANQVSGAKHQSGYEQPSTEFVRPQKQQKLDKNEITPPKLI